MFYTDFSSYVINQWLLYIKHLKLHFFYVYSDTYTVHSFKFKPRLVDRMYRKNNNTIYTYNLCEIQKSISFIWTRINMNSEFQSP